MNPGGFIALMVGLIILCFVMVFVIIEQKTKHNGKYATFVLPSKQTVVVLVVGYDQQVIGASYIVRLPDGHEIHVAENELQFTQPVEKPGDWK